nr:hypothetical protein [Kibdelosporangium sp. MJ126-NF4]CEL18290.1 hypothetical protein [Kibdelosporangium sp. MJ126-NF4]CTQ97775.1 hypothetical protein [Kibdelosporangium sp. MJ126-NF4]
MRLHIRARRTLTRVSQSGLDYLPPWLAGYGVVFTVLGTVLAVRRDVV